ncbi:MAG: LuxR C-terminal-related transcriptional regulator [Pleurocapsa sp. MO_226.B13]|nr:LuxR C-terminal-related transcriptional regulator [Pleurocapsa sp. MO_226.B13]
MDNSLQSLFNSLASASTELDLRHQFMDYISQYFAVQRWGIYLADGQNNLLSYDVHGVSDTFVEKYQKFGKAVDPVMEYVIKYHAPCHEELVLPQGQWKQSELYLKCCSEYDHEHIMTGGIVGNGKLIGTIHFARLANTPAFDTHDLLKLSSVCNHFSACLASLRNQSNSINEKYKNLLTKRELQIANLVARGLTNAEIGKELWISENTVKKALKKMFSKLETNSRTAMIMKLMQKSEGDLTN